MILTNDAYRIGRLYDLITENPDNIRVDGTIYSYDNPTLGNISGMFNDNGKFIMSKKVSGHCELIDAVKNRTLDEINTVSNFDDIEQVYQDPSFFKYSLNHKFRVWPKFKVFSMYEYYVPAFKQVILDIVSKVGNPKTYLYDAKTEKYAHNDMASFKNYDDFFKGDLDSEQAKLVQVDAERVNRNERAISDYMAGVKNKKNGGFYSREGD